MAAGRDALADALEAAGHPVIRIELADPIDLGAEFVRWEVATAIAGAVLGIDPFDQPNVEEAKQLTRDAARRRSRRARPDGPAGAAAEPIADGDGLTLHGDAALRLTTGDGDVVGELARHLARRRPNAYLAPPGVHRPDAGARRGHRAGSGPCCATGPGGRRPPATARASSTRPASSTRAAPPIGWFLQLTADHPTDSAIPGWPYTFGQLIDAQAAGDFAAIEAHDLPDPAGPSRRRSRRRPGRARAGAGRRPRHATEA